MLSMFSEEGHQFSLSPYPLAGVVVAKILILDNDRALLDHHSTPGISHPCVNKKNQRSFASIKNIDNFAKSI